MGEFIVKHLKSVFCAFLLLFIGSMSLVVFASDAGFTGAGEPSCYARIVLVGNFGCGKTSIWKRIFGDRFDERESASDMMMCRTARGTLSDGRNVQFNIWDTTGANVHYSHVIDFLGGATAANFVIVVHDLSSRYTGEVENHLDVLVKDAVKNMRPDGRLIFIGNKMDLAKRSPLNFSKQKALLEHIAHAMGYRMYITSASDDASAPIFITKLLSYIKDSCEEMKLYDKDPDVCKSHSFICGGPSCAIM